jgi:hypothetical protein
MKKLFLLLFSAFILLLSLSLGQNALAANCAEPNTCKLITDCLTGFTSDTCTEGNLCCQGSAPQTTTPSTGTTGGGGGTSVGFKPDELSGVGNPSVPELIGLLVKGALGIVGSIALLMFVYGGFILLISQGDATKITKGKTIMVWAAVGILIIFGSYIFVSYIITELSQNQGGGGATQVCGEGTLAGYACMDKSLGTGCVTKLCPGGANNQCCKAK